LNFLSVRYLVNSGFKHTKQSDLKNYKNFNEWIKGNIKE